MSDLPVDGAENGAPESLRRPLTTSEKRRLRGMLGGMKTQASRASKVSVWAGAGVSAILWALTLMASDVSWEVVTTFWIVVGGGITLWIRRDLRREIGDLSSMASGLESALRREEAEVIDIHASAFVELDEVEDEGACYIFDLGGGRLMLLHGQEFYPDTGFPSLDFSLVYPLDEKGQPVDMIIEKRGTRVGPDRTIAAEIKRTLHLPESYSILYGSLDELEEILQPPT